jgi:molecular chaperone DnaK (HSP70)
MVGRTSDEARAAYRATLPKTQQRLSSTSRPQSSGSASSSAHITTPTPSPVNSSTSSQSSPDILPAPKGVPQIEITFDIDASIPAADTTAYGAFLTRYDLFASTTQKRIPPRYMSLPQWIFPYK